MRRSHHRGAGFAHAHFLLQHNPVDHHPAQLSLCADGKFVVEQLLGERVVLPVVQEIRLCGALVAQQQLVNLLN